MPAERARLTRAAVGLCREGVGQDGSPEYSQKHQEMLQQIA